jgi:hypothetical protein
MSEPASRLPDRPSLEQLRKQAKDLLKQVRAGDDAAMVRMRAFVPSPAQPTLGDAQFVLAREYGFDTWAALVRHVDAVSPQGLRRFETLAQEVATAYTTADVERLREINWTYGTSFRWERESELMHRHLPAWFASPTRSFDDALADARQLVAAMSGFQDWSALAKSVVDQTSIALGQPSSASFYHVDPDTGTIGVRGPLSDRHWDIVTSVIRERGLTGVWGPGASDAAVERLSRAETLTRLHVGGGQVTDEGLRFLSRLPGLQELSLGGPRSSITDRGLEALRRLRNLARFWISWTPHVTDAGVANIAGCERLETVDLMGTHTGDGAMAALAGKRALRKLATGRLVTDAGASRLSEFPRFTMWQGGTGICHVDGFDAEPTHLLLDGPFTDAALVGTGDLDGLFGLNLFWHVTGLTTAAFAAIAAAPRLGFLSVSKSVVMTDDMLIALSRSATLECLACAEAAQVKGPGFAALASVPRLHALTIRCEHIDDASLGALPRFPSLRAFMPARLSDEGYRHVGRCGGIEWLAFDEHNTDAATTYIANLPNLKSLSIPGSKISDRSLAILSRMESLERLELRGCTAITDAGVLLLGSLPKLSRLVVRECPQVTTAATAVLAERIDVRRSSD